jgi:hypothetical protein
MAAATIAVVMVVITGTVAATIVIDRGNNGMYQRRNAGLIAGLRRLFLCGPFELLQR